MKRFIKKLSSKLSVNQRGTAHFLLPVIAVLAVGAIGTFLITQTHAATTHNGVEMGSSGLCVRYSSTSNTVTLQECSASDSGQYWTIGSSLEESTSNGENKCIVPNAVKAGTNPAEPVSVQVCVGSTAQVKAWARPSWSGANKDAYYSVQEYDNGKGPKRCLVDANGGTGGTLETVGCGTAADQDFSNHTLPATSTSPTAPPVLPAPPKPVQPPAPTSACINNTYSTKYGGEYIACVDYLQVMLNGMDKYDHASPALTTDGYYGTLTYNRVTAFQKYGEEQVTGDANPNTWAQLCNIIQARYGSSNVAIYNAYKDAKCGDY